MHMDNVQTELSKDNGEYSIPVFDYAQILALCMGFDPNEVATISFVPRNKITEILPHAKIMSQKQTNKQLLSNIKRIGKGNNPIVIFSDTTPVIDTVINDYLRKPLRKIYFFEGGFDTYKKVSNLNKMTALSNQKKRLSTKKPVSCAN